MADVALAQGPWALLNSADAMRHMIADVATAYRTTSPERSSACLFGQYKRRSAKKTQCRPLPYPDALLAGASSAADSMAMPDDENTRAADTLDRLAKSPWLWQLQWTTLMILLASDKMKERLMMHCPETVASHWGKNFDERVLTKIMGSSATNGLPNCACAAQTPLMLVVSELQLLRLSYERQ